MSRDDLCLPKRPQRAPGRALAASLGHTLREPGVPRVEPSPPAPAPEGYVAFVGADGCHYAERSIGMREYSARYGGSGSLEVCISRRWNPDMSRWGQPIARFRHTPASGRSTWTPIRDRDMLDWAIAALIECRTELGEAGR